MNSTVVGIEWKGEESTRNHSQQPGFPFLGAVAGPVMAPLEFIARCTEVGSLRYASQHAGKDDFEVADEINISHGYMSKVLKGTAGLHGQRLVNFMRATGSLAPLQWLAEQMGCDVVPRDPAKARIQELEREIQQLKRQA